MKKSNRQNEKLDIQSKAIQRNLDSSRAFIDEQRYELNILKKEFDFSDDRILSNLLEEEERQLNIAKHKMDEIEMEIKQILKKELAEEETNEEEADKKRKEAEK